MSQLHPRDLQPGDIILTSTDHWISSAIKMATWSDFSHAILFIGGGKAIEARGDGVREKSLNEAMAPGGTDPATIASVYRYRGGLSGNQQNRIVTFARSKVAAGARYDYWGVSGAESGSCAVFNHNIQENPEAYFCSELVAAAFRHAGAPLSDEIAACSSPQDLADSSRTDFVGNLALMSYAL